VRKAAQYDSLEMGNGNGSSGTFSGLIEVGQVERVTIAFEETIALSFLADKARMTQAEIKRRFNICVDIFKKLRGDLHWGIDRTLHFLPSYLRDELEGVAWTPDRRTMWMPHDGQV
jgi:hypothetical protein